MRSGGATGEGSRPTRHLGQLCGGGENCCQAAADVGHDVGVGQVSGLKPALVLTSEPYAWMP
jgi:hypothetical protein